jgi:hypothetical protein
MKIILGDNQFFGVNHHDIVKGDKTKNQFDNNKIIISFINKALDIGMAGYMINSNKRGFEIASKLVARSNCEVHYSVPYPHKYAAMVNENGLFALLKHVLKQSSLSSMFLKLPKFIFTRDVKHMLPLILDLEIPRNLKKGSCVYLQNVVTDLLIGLKRHDIIELYCNYLIELGFKPGLITLNPVILEKIVSSFEVKLQQELIVCFNINKDGFNVFPDLIAVEDFVLRKSHFKKMGMSILSSGGSTSITESLDYIKRMPLQYVVFGSSSINNIKFNIEYLTK